MAPQILVTMLLLAAAAAADFTAEEEEEAIVFLYLLMAGGVVAAVQVSFPQVEDVLPERIMALDISQLLIPKEQEVQLHQIQEHIV